MKDIAARLVLEHQWSPEQITNRLAYEKSAFRISYPTIYRVIYAGMLDTGQLSHGNWGVIRKLRHRGKTRRRKGTVETRGKNVIDNRIQERPKEADDRQTIGHWEADTVAGETGSACLVTITDRCSRYLSAGKVSQRYSAFVAEKMIALLSAPPKKAQNNYTGSRQRVFQSRAGNEVAQTAVLFSGPSCALAERYKRKHQRLSQRVPAQILYIALSSEDDIAGFVKKSNRRPRKCLAWKTPYEVSFNQSLHLTRQFQV